MEKAILSDVVERFATGLNPRKNFKLNDGGKLKYITIKNIKQGKLANLDSCDLIDEKALGMINERSDLMAGDVLFTSIGATGDCYIVKEKPKDWNINESVFSIRHNDKVIPEYLYYLLSNEEAKKYYRRVQTGSTFKSVKINQLKAMPIKLYDKEEQKRIVKELNDINRMIELKNNIKEDLNSLIISKFYETFMDNEYTMEELSKNVKEMFIGPFGSALKNECFVEKEKSYCMVYEQKHAIKKTLDLPTRYVDENKYNELKRFEVGAGDIIVSCRGTVGEIFVLPDNAPKGIIHPSLMKIKLNSEEYDSKFFIFLLNERLRKISSHNTGSSIKMAITAKELGKEVFIKPELREQKLFVEYITSIEKMVEIINKDINNLEKMLYSKMKEYF